MNRTTLCMGDRPFALAQGVDIVELKSRMVDAIREGGQFVDFVIVGNRVVSALVTVGVRIVLETAWVPADGRDDGDVSHPFDDDIELFVPDSFFG